MSDKPETIHMVMDIPRYGDPPPAPCPFDLADLLCRLAMATVYRFPDGTVGGKRIQNQIRQPQVGDFVVIWGAYAPPSRVLGELVAMDPPLPPLGATSDPHEYTRSYTVRLVSGEVVAWSNVKCYALPVGDVHDLETERGNFAPWRKE